MYEDWGLQDHSQRHRVDAKLGSVTETPPQNTTRSECNLMSTMRNCAYIRCVRYATVCAIAHIILVTRTNHPPLELVPLESRMRQTQVVYGVLHTHSHSYHSARPIETHGNTNTPLVTSLIGTLPGTPPTHPSRKPTDSTRNERTQRGGLWGQSHETDHR